MLKLPPKLKELWKKFKDRKILFYSVIGYIVYTTDAWLLGSLAAYLKGLIMNNTTQAQELFSDPLTAGLKLPFMDGKSYWLFFNFFLGCGIGVLYGLEKMTGPVFPKKLKFTNDPAYGTSRWMSKEEVRKLFEIGYGKGLLIGVYDGQPVRLNDPLLNRNVMVFGSPATGKTRSIIIPAVMQAVASGESIILTDPKDEIIEATREYCYAAGYTVRLINFVDMLHSHRWNPLAEIKEDIDAQNFTEIFIANTIGPMKKGEDQYWDRAEQNLLKALVLYVIREYPREERNMSTLYNILSCGDLVKLDLMFNNLSDPLHPAKVPYNIFSQTDPQMKGIVLVGLGTRLQAFQKEIVQRFTQASDVDLTLPGKKKCAYLCVVSDTDEICSFLVPLFFSLLCMNLTRLGESMGGRCPVNINLLLDGFCNLGQINQNFVQTISNARSRGINCIMATQSRLQLENRYPNNFWQEIINCCDTQLFLGINDTMTAKYLAELLGDSSVLDVSYKRPEGGLRGILQYGRVDYNSKTRKLMTVDEITRMDRSKAIVLISGQYPLMVGKFDYSKHPENEKLTFSSIKSFNAERSEDLKETEITEDPLMDNVPLVAERVEPEESNDDEEFEISMGSWEIPNNEGLKEKAPEKVEKEIVEINLTQGKDYTVRDNG